MASFYDSASIITIPSGYKAGTLYSAKPTDGSGDMTFTRTGDTATRVNSAGLIERCITNLALQSNNFSNASWTKTNTTIGTGITDPNGGTTAFSLAGSSSTSNSKNISQAVFSSGNDVKTFSIYAKANTHSFIQLRFAATAGFVNFDLTNGTLSAGGGASGSMTSLGNGWYRVLINQSTTGTLGAINLVDSLAALINDPSTTTNSVYIWRAQAQTGDFATNYIDTTTAAVTQGPVTNLPRLDYLGSTCPQLLMEPTRTNLATYSQMFDNAIWSKISSISVSPNTILSPDGYTNADTIIAGGSSTTSRISQSFNAVSGTTYAYSFFTKQSPDNPPTSIRILSLASANLAAININFSGGVPSLSTTGLALNAKAENYGNGWYRISGTYVAPATEINRFTYYGDTMGLNRSSYLWGAQVEAGAYATSYIPTTAATVTRNADSCVKSSITSLIGQTEGTFFIDFNKTSDSTQSTPLASVSLNSGSSITRLLVLYQATINTINISSRVNSTTIFDYPISGISNNRVKVAIAYKLNDLSIYINGVQVQSASLSTDFSTYNLTQFSFDNGAGTNQFHARTNQALVFKTRLTNAELATLTTL